MTEKESNEIRNLIHNGQGTAVERLHEWREKAIKSERKVADFIWGTFLVLMTVIYIGSWIYYRPQSNIPRRNPVIDSCTIYHLKKELTECDSSNVVTTNVLNKTKKNGK